MVGPTSDRGTSRRDHVGAGPRTKTGERRQKDSQGGRCTDLVHPVLSRLRPPALRPWVLLHETRELFPDPDPVLTHGRRPRGGPEGVRPATGSPRPLLDVRTDGSRPTLGRPVPAHPPPAPFDGPRAPNAPSARTHTPVAQVRCLDPRTGPGPLCPGTQVRRVPPRSEACRLRNGTGWGPGTDRIWGVRSGVPSGEW